MGATMNADSSQAMQAYKSVDVDTRVLAANPHQLIMMLFDGALAALAQAKVHMLARNIAGQGASISKTITIIDDGLKVSLDEKSGGKLAADLKNLYEYLSLRLLSANLKSDPKVLDEVAGLLLELSSAWREIGKAPAASASTPLGMPKSPLDPQQVARPTMSYGKA